MPDQLRLCSIDELPDPGSKGFQVGERQLFAVRARGQVRVYHNRCPHLGIELEWTPDQFLDAERQFIQCATHGALFLIESGECISGPCSGDRLTPVISEIREGQLWVQLS